MFAVITWIIFIALLIFFARVALAVVLIFICATLWHLGTWWSYPLAAILFFSLFFFTDLLD